MASIIKRKNSYCVVYRYTDEKGKSHQRWESFPTNAEARKRKNQIEYEQDNNVFTIPEARTVRELLVDYMEIYGVNKWAMSTYDAKNSLINNYINPIIGDIPLSNLNPRMMEKYYIDLLKVKSKVINNRKPDHQYLTPSRIREVHKLLRNAFNQAVKWELMTRNPVEHATIPKEKPKKRAMWDLPTFKKALELCDDDDLSLALNLAFSCTLRMGEMLGITLDCIDVSEDKIENGTASIFIEKEVQRVKRDVFEKLNQRDVLFVFPRCLSGGNTVLVLKEPKTETSKRRVYLPKTVAKMVLQRIKDIQEIKELLGDECHDYNLLFSSSTGRPMEGQIITRALKKLIRDHNLPDVCFHSLRHSSITYKLKWSGGDIKAVQGDSGHARADMVTEQYSHILDEDRVANARRVDEQVYNQQPQQTQSDSNNGMNPTELLGQLFANPEMGKAFQAFLQQYHNNA